MMGINVLQHLYFSINIYRENIIYSFKSGTYYFLESENSLVSTGLSKDSIKSDCLGLLDQYAGFYKEG